MQVFSYGVNLGHVLAVLIWDKAFSCCVTSGLFFYSVNNLGAEFLFASVNQILLFGQVLIIIFLGGGGGGSVLIWGEVFFPVLIYISVFLPVLISERFFLPVVILDRVFPSSVDLGQCFFFHC